ncbi:MAG: MvaI/BcnI restriction endonuclease family protein [Candidatus Diapherotrites archaeon]|uniref:MvaI/BcnI restriction endonuclease family protein n=1 Tax=Candidatus Iainarchaeum sp. TaxID=3101447 RepID=A0A8T3YM11_9ARCH|nr:MvaI/BcnI restriction endonuclease family protein [Candidatus Diapherotrites archaeon]
MLTYEEFIAKLKEIKKVGWIKTHRTGNTGIGKTFEDLVNIKENNIAGPDLHNFELKSARKNSKSMLTLFTKSPLPPKANAGLLKKYGYPSAKWKGRKELHTTAKATGYNTLKGKKGFKISARKNKLILVSAKNQELGYWDKSTLKNSFERKYPALVYVKAESKGRGGNEEFWFNEAYLLQEFNFERFIELVKQGLIAVDIRIGQYSDGRPHDHGTGFRVMPGKLDLCFKQREQIL